MKNPPQTPPPEAAQFPPTEYMQDDGNGNLVRMVPRLD